MFRLMRLEDRIVLDGAAFTDALDEMQKQKLHEQQMFDADASDDAADAHDDVHYRSGIDTADPLFIVDDALPDSSGTHVLVVSSKLEGADDLAAAVNDNVIVVKYDPAETSLKDLADTIRDALGGDQADSIAFASHNAGEGALGIGIEPISADSLAADAAQQEFWKTVGGSLAEDGRIDLLACSVVGTDAGEYLVSQIENISGANVAASSDATGNDAYGGDWVLESDDINIEATYFDSELLVHVEGVFGAAPPVVANEIPNITVNWTGTDWPSINYKLPTLAGGTLFTDADGDPLTYDAYEITSGTDYILDTSPGTQFPGLAFMDGSQTLVGNTDYFAVAPEIGDDYEIRVVATDASSSQTEEQTFFLSFRDPNSTLPKATLSVSGSPMAENGGVATVTVTLDADAPAGGASIVLGFGGDAESGDYTPSGGVIDITAGGRSGSITLTANDDPDSMDETVLVSIDSVSGAQEDGVQQVAATITDDEGSMPTVTLGISSTQIAEQGTPQNLTAYLSSAAPVGGITVNLDFTGTFDSGDYTAANSIFISAGNTVGSITVTANDDADLKNESLNISVLSSTDYAMGSPATVNATLVDNDYPSVTLSLSSTTFNEEGGTTNVIATLSEAAPAGADIYVSFAGTAGAGQYTVTPAGTVITIGPGGSTGQLTLTGKSDTITEGDQTVVVDIVTATGAQEAGTQQVTATILDDDLVTVSLSASDASFSEEGGSTVITATLNKAAGTTVQVNLGFSGTADGNDFSASASTIFIGALSTSGFITLTGKTDTLIEGDEIVDVSIASVNGASTGTPSSVTTTVLDNDYSVVTLGISTDSFSEVGGTADITAYLDQPAGPGGVTVDLTYGGTAAASDFTVSPQSIYIAENLSSGVLTVTGFNDSLVEADETLTATISNISGPATAGTTNQVSTIITDDDAVYVSLGVNNASMAENGGNATVTAYLSKATDHPVTVDLSFGGVATATDYSLTGSSIVINTGDTSGFITVTATSDATVEGDESLLISASGITGASDGTPLSVTTNIIDDDFAGVTLGISGSPFAEKGGVATVTATLDSPSQNNVIVNLALAGTADASDYTASATSITIIAGQTTGTMTLTGVDDSLFEYSETIVVDIDSVSGGATEASPQQVTAEISDDEVPVATLGISKVSIAEKGGTAIVTLTLDKPAQSGGVTVALGISGTVSSNDYLFVGGTDFYIGQYGTTATKTVYGVSDTYFEGNESFIISIGTISGASRGTQDVVNAAIIDDDTAPSVTIGIDPAAFAEGTSAVVTATMSYESAVPVTVDLSYSGTALGDDYTAGTSIVIQAGDTTGTTTIAAATDTYYEGDETVIVDIAAVSNATEIGTQQATATITDANAMPTITLGLNNSTFIENGGSTVVTATLSYESYANVTVDFDLAGTADASDYTTSGATLVIPAGSTSGVLTITGQDDGKTEVEESVIVSIGTVTGASEAVAQTVTAGIIDDEGEPGVTLSLSSPSFVENAGTSLVIATLDHSTYQDVSVSLGFTGTAGSTEYTYSQNYILITAGQTTGSVLLTGVDDPNKEVNETVVVDITTVNGASETTAQTVTANLIDDDGKPGVTLSLVSASFSETGPGSTTVVATLAAASVDPVTIDLSLGGTAFTGTDYTLPDGTQITIAAGQTTGSIQITAINDSTYEGDETVVVDILSVTGASETTAQQVTATLADNDSAPTVTLAKQGIPFLEDGGVEAVDIVLSEASALHVTVDLLFSGTAEFGTDYTASGTSVVIPPGSTSSNVVLSSSNDGIYEGNESIVVSIDNVINASDAAPAESVTVTIIEENSPPAVTLAATVPTFMEGSSTPAVITASLSEASALDTTVTLSFSGSAETVDYTADPAAQIFISAGNTTGTVELTSSDDAIFEGNESVIVEIASLSEGVTGGTTTSATATLVDNDQVSVSLGISNASFAEDGGSTDVIAYLNGESAETITLNLVYGGTAGAGDFTAMPTSITIAPGTNTTGSITLTPFNDSLYEGDETVTVDSDTNWTVGGVDSPASVTGTHPVTATITDAGDLPDVTLGFSNASFAENGGTSELVLTLSKESTENVTVDLTYSGTAGSTDYSGALTSVVINAGSMTGSLVITGLDDSLYEGSETVTAEISAVDGATAAANTTATANITDDDGEPTVTLSVSSDSIAEAGGTSVITATLNHPSGTDITVELGYTGTAGASDYTSAATLVISAGDTTGTVLFTAADDSMYEGNEGLDISIVSVSGASEAVAQTRSITIVDDDSAPGVTLALSPASFAEDGGTSVVTATLDNPSALDVTVDLSFTGGTAEYGTASDFSASATYIVITAGSTTGTIELSGVADSSYEGDETAVVDIVNVTNATEATAQQVTATIDDSADYPSVTLSVTPGSFSENGGTSSLVATLSQPTYETVTVEVAFGGTADYGTDYTGSTTITIAPDSSSGSVTLTGQDDPNYEDHEIIDADIVAVTNATFGSTLSVSATLAEDDGDPAVTLSLSKDTFSESGGTSIVTATLSGTSINDITVGLDFSGSAIKASDYSVIPASIFIPSGSTMGTVKLTGMGDNHYEGDETVEVMVSSGALVNASAGSPASVTATIVDDDGLPSVTLGRSTDSIAEDGGSVTLTAYLSHAALGDVTVDLLFTGGTAGASDFSPAAASSITIASGSTTASITLTGSGDNIYEGTETIVVDIASVSGNGQEGTPGQVSVAINDAESEPTVTLGVNPAAVDEDAGGTSVVTATLNNASTQTVTINLAVSGDSTAAETEDYSLSATQIIISAGNTTGTAILTAIDDSVYESGGESVILEIDSVLNASEATAQAQTVTINDADPMPEVTLSVTKDTFPETLGKTTVVATLSAASAEDVTVDLEFTGGTAELTTDYTTLSSRIIISAGNTTGTLVISSVSADTTYELDETVKANLLSVSGASEATAQTITATIVDDDALSIPKVTLSLDPNTTFAEAGGTTNVVATLDKAAGVDVTVNLDYAGTAVDAGATDYSASGTYIFITAGNTTGTVTLTGVDDNTATVYEGDETVVVSLGVLKNATEGVTADVTATIDDSADAPDVDLRIMSGFSNVIAEDGGSTVIEAYIPYPSNLPITVTLAFTDGSATAEVGTDYTVDSAFIVISAGYTAGQITLSGVEDFVDEGTGETAIVDILTVSNGTAGSTGNSQSITLTDNDSAASVYLSISDVTFLEDGGFTDGVSTITATLTQPVQGDVTVTLAFSGTATYDTDYKFLSGGTDIFIPQGSTTGTVTLWAQDDLGYEGDETVEVSIGALAGATVGVGTPGTVSATIIEDDTPPAVNLSLNPAAGTFDEDGGTIDVVATLTAAAATTVTIDLDLSGGTAEPTTDFDAAATTSIVISAGETTGTITITGSTDDVYEGDETLVAAIGTISGGATMGTTSSVTATIDDSTDYPEVTLSVNAPGTFGENDGTSAVVVATLSNTSESPVVVDLYFTGTALSTEYIPSGTQITIAAGDTTGSIELYGKDDLDLEAEEVVSVGISTVSGGTESGVQEVSASLVDDDAGDGPEVTLSISNLTFSENFGTTVVMATLSNTTINDVYIDLSFSGDASVDTDFNAGSSQIVISAGSTTGTLTLKGSLDGKYEGDELVVVDILSITNGTEIGTEQVTATLEDYGSTMPTVTLGFTDESFDESGGTTYVTAYLSEAAGVDVTVNLDFTGGTADIVSDYTTTGTYIVIQANKTTGTVSLTGVNNAVYEDTESVVVDIASIDNATFGVTVSATASIDDSDDLPEVSLTQLTGTWNEVSGQNMVTVHLSNASEFPVTVDLDFTGDAQRTTDYTASATRVVIAAGATSTSLALSPILEPADDSIAEGNESVYVSLGTVTGGTEGSPAFVLSTIEDDEGTPTVTLSLLNGSMAETGGVSTVVATLSAESADDVTVSLASTDVTATFGDDYKPTNNDLYGDWDIVIPAGQTTGTFQFSAAHDNFYEGNETFTIGVDGITNAITAAPATLTATIIDDDPMPVVNLSLSKVTFAEEGGSTVVTATLSTASDVTTTISLSFTGSATEGTAAPDDYAVTNPNPIVIAAGAMTGSVVLNGLGDNSTTPVYEGSLDDITVEIASITNATFGTVTSVTATIDDSEDMPTVTLGSAVASCFGEDFGTAVVTAYLSNQSELPVTVDLDFSGTALYGTDYATDPPGAASIVVPALSDSGSITLTALNDNLSEGDETVVVDIATVDGGTEATSGATQITETIVDDPSDAPTVSLSLSSYTFMEDGGTTELTVTLDNPAYEDVTVDLKFSVGANNDAEFGTDFTASETQVVIPAGQTTQSVILTGITDDRYELGDPDYDGTNEVVGYEYFDISIVTVAGAGATSSGVDLQNVAIDDSADLPSVTLSLSQGTIDEGTGTATIVTATMSNPSEEDVLVNLGFSGTATEGSDYSHTAGAGITINADDTTGTATITAIDDSMTYYEYQESVIVDIASFGYDNFGDILQSGATIGATAQVTATITDEEDKPDVYLWFDAGEFDENGGSDFLFADLYTYQGAEYNDVKSAVPITVTISLGGTATQGEDYTADTTIVIPANSLDSSIIFTGLDDSNYEGPETVVATITAVENGDIDWGFHIDTATINDYGDEPIVTLSVDGSPFAENGGTAVITATLNSTTILPVTVDLAFSGIGTYGSDYSADLTQIVIPGGSTTGTAILTGIDDEAYEGTESVVVEVVSVTNASEATPQTVTASITDDDPMPTVTLSMSSDSFSENGGSATVTATLDRISNDPVVVTIDTIDNGATAPASDDGGAESGDYTSGTTTITINPGDLTGTISLSGVNDSVYEGDETFMVEITTVSGGAEDGTQSLMTTIVEDDVLNIGITDAGMTEGDSPVNPLVTLTVQTAAGTTATDSEYPLTVDWLTQDVSATAGSDYTAFSGTVNLGGGGSAFTTASIQVQILSDNDVEGNETFNVNLAFPSTGIITDFRGIATIIDDDQYAAVTANTGLTLDEQTTDFIDYTMLEATDDAPATGTDIIFTLSSGPAQGTLFIDADSSGTYNAGDTALTAGGTFTQQDIDDGKIGYRHTGTPGSDSFSFTVNNPADTPANPSPESGTFSITVADVNQAPTANGGFIQVTEGTTGVITAISNIDDADGDTVTLSLADNYGGLFSLSSTSVDTSGGAGAVDVLVNGVLDYEYLDKYVLTVNLDDGQGGAGITSVIVAVSGDGTANDYNISAIPIQTISQGNVMVFDASVYFNTELTAKEYTFTGLDTSWMTDYGDGILLLNGATGPASTTSYTITINAVFDHFIGADDTLSPATTFTVDYIVADLDTDALMDALYYLEGGEESELPAEGEVVDINQVMIASAEEPVYYEAPVAEDAPAAEGDAVVDPELAEIIALLDQEAVITDPETQMAAGPDSETV